MICPLNMTIVSAWGFPAQDKPGIARVTILAVASVEETA